MQFLVRPPTRGPSWMSDLVNGDNFNGSVGFGSPSANCRLSPSDRADGRDRGPAGRPQHHGREVGRPRRAEGRSGLRKRRGQPSCPRLRSKTVERSGGIKPPPARRIRCWPPTSWQRPSWPGPSWEQAFPQHLQQPALLGRGLFRGRLGFGIIKPSSRRKPSWRAPSSRAGFSSAGAASASAFLAGAFFFAGAFLGAGCSLAGFPPPRSRPEAPRRSLRVRSLRALSNRKSTTLSSYQRRAQLGGGHRLGLDVFDEKTLAILGAILPAPPAGSASGTFSCPVTSTPLAWPIFPTTAGPDAPGARQSPCTRVLLVLDLLQRSRRDLPPARASCWSCPQICFELGFDHRLRDREIVTPAAQPDRAALASSGCGSDRRSAAPAGLS